MRQTGSEWFSQSSQDYVITWDTDILDGVAEYVDIVIMGYSEDVVPSIADVYSISSVQGVPYSDGRHEFRINVLSLNNLLNTIGRYGVGMIAVKQRIDSIGFGGR